MARQRGSEFGPEIRRGRFDRLTIYEVTETELELLEMGAPNSIYLNFAIGLLSLASSFLICLLTTTIESMKTFTVFVVLAVVGTISGIVLLVLWYWTSKSIADIAATIRNRLPPEPTLPPEPPGT